MASENLFPRHRRAPGRPLKNLRPREPKRKEESLEAPAGPSGIDVARYIADMTAQLEAMATAAHLDLLAYFLGMAKAESELFARTNAPEERESPERFEQPEDESSGFTFPTDE